MEDFHTLEQIIDENYPQMEHLFKYLDKEDLMKTNLLVSPSLQKVSCDVEEFRAQKLALTNVMEICEHLYENFDLLQILQLSQ